MEERCSICSGEADQTFKRVEIWSNERWRLTISTYKAVRGFCYLEPKRHIPYITELDGIEAEEFGSNLARATRAIKNSMDAKLVYVYIYGGHIPHLHVHLAPNTEGDVFADDVIRSDVKIDENTMRSDEEITLREKISMSFQKEVER